MSKAPPARRSTRPSRQRQPKSPQLQSERKLPFLTQHQDRPGIESKLKPRPRWEAARYRAAGKPEGKVALITGGDITGIVLPVMGGETTGG